MSSRSIESTTRFSNESTRGRLRLLALVAFAMLIGVALSLQGAGTAHALQTVNQKDYALISYDVKGYTTVKNKKLANVKTTKFKKLTIFQKKANTYKSSKGNKASMKTFAFLPVSFDKSGDMGNPQSINMTPDGHYAYVTYPKTKTSTTGRIVRYDMWKMAELGLDSGDMSKFRRATWMHLMGNTTDKYFAKNKYGINKELYNEYMSCIKFGPWCKIGHGNAFSYNPKDGCLWFIGKTGAVKTNIQRINMDTLTPDLKINFKMSNQSNKAISNNLTFDNEGRVYFYSYSAANSAIPEGTIRIFQGNIRQNKKVTFSLVTQGIRNSPTRGIQSMSYNPKSNRLYMVANDVIASVPVAKLGKLKKSDVRTTVFKTKREYEDITFDSKGNGYLLIIGYSEILKMNSGF